MVYAIENKFAILHSASNFVVGQMQDDHFLSGRAKN